MPWLWKYNVKSVWGLCKYLSIRYADKMTTPSEHGKELNCLCVHFINLTTQPEGRQKLYLHVGSEAV